MSDNFDFSGLEPATQLIKNFGGRDYLLHEASTAAASAYKNAEISSATYEDGHLKKIEGRADADAILLSGCITYEDGAEKGQLVPLRIIKAWLERATKPMIEWIKEYSDLDDKEDPLKKSLQKALDRPDSPVTFDGLCDWVAKWSDSDKNDKELRMFHRLLKPTIEERTKNGQRATTDTSA